jgi:hypothetical protein
MKKLATAEAVFEALGGITAVAELTGAKYVTVHRWKTVGKFPPKTFVLLESALTERGCKAPSELWKMLEPI